MKRKALLSLFAPVLLSACAGTQVTLGDPFIGLGRWFTPEKEIEVSEAGRSQRCGTQGPLSRAQLLGSAAAVREWEAAREVRLAPADLPDGAYALIEMGERGTGGYGFAVSRVGGRRGDTALLRLTSFAPGAGRSASGAPSAPCVLVALPAGNWKGLRVADQSGAIRAEYPEPDKK